MVQENVLEKIDSDQLSVLVVWTPVLSSDNRASVDKAARTITDNRAAHFWDGDRSLGNTYGKIVELPRGRSLAWDIYFAFDRDTRWNETAPEPDDWAHQLGGDARSLRNGDKLREAINRLLP